MITCDIDGIQISLIEAHDRQVLHMQRGVGYEHDSLIVWSRMVKAGAVALDVGAYTGLYSIVAARRGARAVAIEPMPANIWRLRVNASRNKVRVEPIAAAATDYEGTATLNHNPKVALTTGASLESGIGLHSAGIVVNCITIDALGLTNVAAMKIDVERHEPCVLRGAMRTIERDRPSLLIETLDEDMRKRISSMLPSYDVAVILDHRNTLFTPR